LSSLKGEFYEQISSVAMEFPPSSIMENLFMEHFEKNPLDSYHFSPTWWKIFVDDTIVEFPHGIEKLDMFLKYLNY